jgi:hypothetical protein
MAVVGGRQRRRGMAGSPRKPTNAAQKSIAPMLRKLVESSGICMACGGDGSEAPGCYQPHVGKCEECDGTGKKPGRMN